MSLEELLSALSARDIRLRVEGEALRFNAPPGALTAELRAEIAAHKSALLEMIPSPAPTAEFPPLIPRREAGSVPLTAAQERLWFVDQIYPGDPGFNITRNVWLRGPVDAERLERSLALIVQRHEVLRTVVDRSGEQPVAVTLPAASWSLRRMNLLGASDAELAKLIRKEADHHFDLTRGPLFRATLAQKQPDEHLLLLNFHHLVFDGSSTALFFRELSEIYRALEAGREPQLPELKIQFGDFAVWQRERLKTSALDRELTYWRQQLSGHRELAILPTDRPRSGWNTHRVGQVLAHVPKERLEQLEAFARAEGITLYMLLLAAYETVLHRFTGMGEVRVGSPVSARTRVETEPLLGFLLNVLVMRAEFSPDLTVRGLLQAVKQTALEGFAHREVPMEQLAADLRKTGDARGSGFFQAFFNLLNFEEAELSLPGVAVQHVPLRLIDAAFELSLFMQPGPDGLRAAWNYQVDLFVPETVERLSAAFLSVLEAMVARPDARVAELPLLGSLEQFRLLSLGKGPAQDVPQDRCLHELIEMQAARTPEAIAVRLEETTLTYAALDARANQLAHYLRQRGVGPDNFVAVLATKSTDLMVAVLAVLKAGGAYVPIDPAMPAERIQMILEDARPVVVLTELAFAAALASVAAPIVRLDADRAVFAAQPAWNPLPAATASNLAYAIYTSGSSGRPKGVLIEHRAVVNHTMSAIAAYGLGTEDRVLQFASLSFDASAEEIFPALASGAELVLRPETMIETPATFLARSREWGLTVLDLPTAYWHELVWGMETEALSWPTSVRVVIIGGEKARLDRLVSWRQLAGESPRLFNTYGPTEATIVATRWEAPADEHALRKLTELPIGTAISNTFTTVLDVGLNPVPVGVPGELHIGGAGLARGYLKRAELMAQKFIAHPALGGARLYKTGDLVRLRADGQLEFCGRVDQQVKIRGFRIELGDIETALAAHPGIAGCAVTDFVDAQGERRLAAYFVAAAAPPATRELRSFLLKSLPDYMVPTVFAALPALPLNTSGKVDRRALPPPVVSETVVDAESLVPPEPGLETTIANVWAEVLHRPSVGATDNFFELGGHSLLATRVVARLRDSLGCGLPLRWMFEAPTVRELARRVESLLSPASAEEREQAASLAALPDLVPGARRLLSDSQEALRFLHRLDPASAAYNIATLVKYSGPLDVGVLQRALSEIVARHEALRTRFGERDGVGEMLIQPPLPAELPVTDVVTRPGVDLETAARELVQKESHKPFDLERGPVFRTHLLRLGPERHWLVITVHHIVSDGWSIELLLDELALLYGAFVQGKPSSLPPLRHQFANFVAWQRARLESGLRETELSYWRQELAGAPEQLELPADYPRAEAGDASAHVSFTIPARVLGPLRALAAAERSTLFMVLMGAFQAVLSRSAGQEEVCVGSPVAGRTHLEAEQMQGCFVGMLVFRASLAGNPTFREFLHQVRERALGAFSHQELPVNNLVAELNPLRQGGTSPLFQAVFALHNERTKRLLVPGLAVEVESLRNPAAKFDVAVAAKEIGDDIDCSLEYRSGLFRPESMRALVGRFQRMLEEVAARPDERVGNFALMTPAERERVLVEWNHTATPFPREATVPGLFEQEVARRPDAVALVLGDESVTYTELNQRANRLAHWLRQRDVAPGVNVAVCLERSIEMVVTLLAILKSGGAYVPLDVSQPPERHKFIVDDAQPVLVLTDRRLARGLQGVSAPVVCLDEFSRSLITLSAENPVSGAQATTRAYVLYTSGSTGRPKGVLVPHRGIVRLVRDTNYATFGPDEVFLQLAPVAFDASTLEIWGSLLNGGRLVIMPPGLNSVDDIAAVLQRHRVTTLWLTAGLFHHVVETRVEALRGLRQLLAGGDVLAPAAVQKVLREVPGCRMINGYGPTENTTFTCCHTITAADAGQGSVPIGRPISNTRVYVLDAQFKPVPVGVPGELFIAGDGLATGYLNRPELTASKFVADPFAGGPGEKMYRSGDRVRWRADGTIEFLGRLDNQVKIRGFRVEPGEVEMALSEMPGVQQAAVVVQEARPGEKRLVGFYVARPETPLSVATVKQHLAARLPAYLVPAVLAPLDALPLTLNGKVDRAVLAAHRVTVASDASYVAPRTPTEERVAAIWAEILNLERVGVQDTFFDLGGHSLAALRVISRINAEFSTDLPLRRLFEQPTAAALAALLDSLRSDSAAADAAARRFVSLSPLRTSGNRRPLFLLSGGDADDAELLLTARIAQDMSPDQPVYGFVSRGFDGLRAPHHSVREMARDYVLELKRVQPKGPYLLGGICLGCLVASEMAAQLLEAGDAVAPLSFVVPRPPPSRWEVFLELNPLGKVFQHLRRLFSVPASERLRYLWFRVRNAPKRLINPLPTAGHSNFAFRAAHLHALLSHRVRPMPLSAIFIMDEKQHHGSWAKGWSHILRGGITPSRLQGDHHSCLREHSTDTAHKLQQAVDQAAHTLQQPETRA